MFIDSPAPAQRADTAAPASRDAGENRRRAAAMTAAFLVHAAAMGLLLVRLPAAGPPMEIASIPVEIVPEAAPKPKVEAEAEPEPEPQTQVQPESQPQPEQPRTSGGESDRAPGRAAAAPPPKDSPVPTPKPARSSPKRLLPSPDLSLPAEPSAASIPFDPPPPPETEQAMIAAPPVRGFPAPSSDMGPLPGDGGGDPYLNAVRDAILGRFAYPPEAVSAQLAGTARYAITLDRRGNLIELQLLQSAGSSILDRAGMETIKRAAPFGPPPSDVAGERVGLVFTLSMAPPSASQN